MTEKSTCTLDLVTKNRLEFAGKCIKIRKKEPNAFYTQQYIINKLIQEYLDKIGIEPMPKDTTEDSIKSVERYLQQNRIDVNLKKSTKEDLKAFSNVLLKWKIIDRKLNYNDIITILLNKYLELYPELAKDLLESRYINQKIGMDELTKQKEKERLDI